MKYLGIDYGTKRIGVAVSDESATLAFPLGTINAGKDALKEVLDIARENAVAGVVVGESRDYQGNANAVMKDIAPFIEQLKTAGLDVILEPEFMSSMMAARQFAPPAPSRLRVAGSRKQMPSQEKLDASAAALILQNYLDRLKRN